MEKMSHGRAHVIKVNPGSSGEELRVRNFHFASQSSCPPVVWSFRWIYRYGDEGWVIEVDLKSKVTTNLSIS